MQEKIFTVSEYVDRLNEGLRNYGAKIIGEVSSANLGPTGHVYFYLKDDKDQSLLKCVIFKSKYDLYGVEIKDGVKIIAFGSPNMHKQYGFSFVAETIEYAGEGLLKKEYEKLKKKLSEQGLFEVARKRPLPSYPQKIGIITALKGAVIADFSNNLEKFGFRVKMIDCRVDGQIAVNDLLSSIKAFKKEDIEVLVIMRGGGSLESLIAFNNEKLVLEVANFKVPVIAAIGHHKDVPLVAMAADVSVSTPTAAANILNQSWSQAALSLERYQRNIKDNFQNILLNVRMALENALAKSFSGFSALALGFSRQLEYIEKAISANNPERRLALGYSIARCGNRIVRRTADVRLADDIDLRVMDGTIISKIKKINKKND